GYSYWTFSDIFEENYFASQPFHGGFGLLNIHGIAKPAYRTYELLHALGTELLPVEGRHETVDMWAVRGAGKLTLLLTNFALPRHPIATETIQVQVQIGHAKGPAKSTIRRIDADHSNARRRWQEMGSPEYLSTGAVKELHDVSECTSEPFAVDYCDGIMRFEVTLPPLAVAAVTVAFGDA
ncbi:MAG TPA: hypothetical protein VIY09_04460, partial [Rhizomicrobium sp.]